jgi:hypothetical protein
MSKILDDLTYLDFDRYLYLLNNYLLNDLTNIVETYINGGIVNWISLNNLKFYLNSHPMDSIFSNLYKDIKYEFWPNGDIIKILFDYKYNCSKINNLYYILTIKYFDNSEEYLLIFINTFQYETNNTFGNTIFKDNYEVVFRIEPSLKILDS